MGRKRKITTEMLLPLIREGCDKHEIAARLSTKDDPIHISSVTRALQRIKPDEIAEYELTFFQANEREISSRQRMMISKLIEKKLSMIDPNNMSIAEMKKLFDMSKELWEKDRVEDGLPSQLIAHGHVVDPKQLEEMKQIAKQISGKVHRESIPQIEYDEDGMIIEDGDEGPIGG